VATIRTDTEPLTNKNDPEYLRIKEIELWRIGIEPNAPSRPLVAATARECLRSRVIGNFPHARCIADSSISPDYAIGPRYHRSRRQDSQLIIIRQQAHPSQEELKYEAEVDHLKHTKFVGLKDDKDPAKIVKET
jgi:hypothetical protein